MMDKAAENILAQVLLPVPAVNIWAQSPAVPFGRRGGGTDFILTPLPLPLITAPTSFFNNLFLKKKNKTKNFLDPLPVPRFFSSLTLPLFRALHYKDCLNLVFLATFFPSWGSSGSLLFSIPPANKIRVLWHLAGGVCAWESGGAARASCSWSVHTLLFASLGRGMRFWGTVL